MRDRKAGEDCIVSTWPKATQFDGSVIKDFTQLQDIISNTRDIRNQRGVNQREELELFIQKSNDTERLLGPDSVGTGAKELLQKSGVFSSVSLTDDTPDNALPFLVGNDKGYLVLNEKIDLEGERAKINEEIARLEKQVAGVTKKLSNERFVNNAPEAVVALERKKLADWGAKINSLRGMV